MPVPTGETAPLLTAAQQSAYLTRLARGASPAAACASLGLSLTAVLATMDRESTFRAHLQQINHLLSQNVAAALYRAAMQGNVSAQTFLLKVRPPPDWQVSDESQPSEDELNRLTDDELDALLREAEENHPPEAAS